MDIDLAAIKLKKIIACVKEGKANGLEAKEILIDLEQVYPPRTIIKEIEKEPVSSEEKLLYMKNYRKIKKEEAQIDTEREKIAFKINRAKERTYFKCFNCKEGFYITNPEDNIATIVKKHNRINENIQISNFCPKCGKKVTMGGGILR